jgi:hypothetical protein
MTQDQLDVTRHEAAETEWLAYDLGEHQSEGQDGWEWMARGDDLARRVYVSSEGDTLSEHALFRVCFVAGTAEVAEAHVSLDGRDIGCRGVVRRGGGESRGQAGPERRGADAKGRGEEGGCRMPAIRRKGSAASGPRLDTQRASAPGPAAARPSPGRTGCGAGEGLQQGRRPKRGPPMQTQTLTPPTGASISSPMPESAVPRPNPATRVAVTTHDVGRARFILLQAAGSLDAQDPAIRDDAALFLDMLDAEGGDAVDLLRAALRTSLEAEAQAAACKIRAAQLAERQHRHEARAAALAAAVHQAMRDLGIPHLRDAEFTASRRDGVVRVEVSDASLLPGAFVRTKHEPDKAALLAALKAGQTIPGAILAQGDETLTVKVK